MKKNWLVHLTYKNNTSADLSKVFTMLKWLEEKILISKTYKNQIVHRSISAILGCETKFLDKIKKLTFSSQYMGFFFLLNSTYNKKKYCFVVSKRPHQGQEKGQFYQFWGNCSHFPFSILYLCIYELFQKML